MFKVWENKHRGVIKSSCPLADFGADFKVFLVGLGSDFGPIFDRYQGRFHKGVRNFPYLHPVRGRMDITCGTILPP